MAGMKILFEDNDFVAFDKPSGLISQMSIDRNRENAHALAEKSVGVKLFQHHRLDKDTSGVLLFVKNSKINGLVTDLFRDRKINKKYLCGVINRNSQPIEAIEKDQFVVECFMAPVRTGQKIERMVVVKKGGWHSKTQFQWIRKEKDRGLLYAFPETGRTHQIRVHLASLKLPIAFDNLYGGRKGLEGSSSTRMLLHASSLEFAHPIDGKVIKIEAETPIQFEQFVCKPI